MLVFSLTLVCPQDDLDGGYCKVCIKGTRGVWGTPDTVSERLNKRKEVRMTHVTGVLIKRFCVWVQ